MLFVERGGDMSSTAYGVSEPISTGGPTELDVVRNCELEKVCSYFFNLLNCCSICLENLTCQFLLQILVCDV